MTSPAANQIISRVEATFANGVPWTSPSNVSATAWELPAYHLIWSEEVASESEIRKLWEDRKGRQAFPVVPAGSRAEPRQRQGRWATGRSTQSGSCPQGESSNCCKLPPRWQPARQRLSWPGSSADSRMRSFRG